MPPEAAVARWARRWTPPASPRRTRSTRARPHGYSMDDTSMYDERGAERSFDELHALLDRTLRD